MKYILLVYHHEKDFAALGEETHTAMLEESIRLAHQITSGGQYLAAPLEATSAATCIRVRDHRTVVTDGPYAETHEQLAGYFLIDATNLDEAIRTAAKVPGATIGTIEIRPIRDVPGLPAAS
ncbi:MAG TPA: YciI family protein [Nitrospira sp.]|nr:YciI family protein [Nitrospira sp.]